MNRKAAKKAWRDAVEAEDGEAKAAAATDAASPSPPRVVPNFDALDLNSVSSSDSELDVEMDGRDDLAASIAAEIHRSLGAFRMTLPVR